MILDGLGFLQIMIFVRYLTAVLLSMHALLGCCWHHAHAVAAAPELGNAAKLTHRAEAHAACCSHHPISGNPVSSNIPGDGSDHRHECQGDRCVFVRVEATQVPPLAFLNIAAEFVPLPCQPALLGGGDYSWVRADGHLAAAPLRLHLLHQILLI